MDTAMAIGCVTMLLSNLEGCRPCRHPCRVSLWATFRFDTNALGDFASIFRRKRATFQEAGFGECQTHLAGERSSMSITLLGNQ